MLHLVQVEEGVTTFLLPPMGSGGTSAATHESIEHAQDHRSREDHIPCSRFRYLADLSLSGDEVSTEWGLRAEVSKHVQVMRTRAEHLGQTEGGYNPVRNKGTQSSHRVPIHIGCETDDFIERERSKDQLHVGNGEPRRLFRPQLDRPLSIEESRSGQRKGSIRGWQAPHVNGSRPDGGDGEGECGSDSDDSSTDHGVLLPQRENFFLKCTTHFRKGISSCPRPSGASVRHFARIVSRRWAMSISLSAWSPSDSSISCIWCARAWYICQGKFWKYMDREV